VVLRVVGLDSRRPRPFHTPELSVWHEASSTRPSGVARIWFQVALPSPAAPRVASSFRSSSAPCRRDLTGTSFRLFRPCFAVYDESRPARG